jgi:hypothetical protein
MRIIKAPISTFEGKHTIYSAEGRIPPLKHICQENGVNASLFINYINRAIKAICNTIVLMCYLAFAGKSPLDTGNEMLVEPMVSQRRRQPCQLCM